MSEAPAFSREWIDENSFWLRCGGTEWRVQSEPPKVCIYKPDGTLIMDTDCTGKEPSQVAQSITTLIHEYEAGRLSEFVQ